MSISDSSGSATTRPTSENRADAARGDSGSARYEADDTGSGNSFDQSKTGGAANTGSDSGNAFDGADATGESRPCAKIIWYDQWYTAEDERVCPECAPLDGQWFEQGSGPAPPLHDNCRCERRVVWWDCYQSEGSWEKGGRAQ